MNLIDILQIYPLLKQCSFSYTIQFFFNIFTGTGEKNNKPSAGSEGDQGVYIDPLEALNKLLHLLNRFHTIFQKHGLDSQLISRIFREIFYYICAGTLNNILLRKDMCHWSKGMQIRYNVAQVCWLLGMKIYSRDQNSTYGY